MTIQDLPLINACLNALATVFLTLGYFFIKKGNKIAHKKCMISAFLTSAVFLTCYLIYHFQYRGGDKVCKPNLVSSNLSSYFDYSRNFSSGNFTAYFYDFQSSLKGAL